MDSSKPIDISEFEPSDSGDPRSDPDSLLPYLRSPQAAQPNARRLTSNEQNSNEADYLRRVRDEMLDVPASNSNNPTPTPEERKAQLRVVGPLWRAALGVSSTRRQVQIEPVQMMDMSQPPIISDQEQCVG